MTIVWPGTVGATHTNDTDKIQFQFVCSLINTCGMCYQYHLAVAKWWPKMHDGCNCQSVPIYPGQSSAPYEDWRKIIANLDPEQKAKVVGKSNMILIEAGVVKWEDVVRRTRVRLLREVVSRENLTVKQMTDAGVKKQWAERAHATVNTPAHQLAAQQRTELIQQIQQLGIQPKHLKEMFGERMAQRIGIGGGPSGRSTMPAGRSDAEWVKLLQAGLKIAAAAPRPPRAKKIDTTKPGNFRTEQDVAAFLSTTFPNADFEGLDQIPVECWQAIGQELKELAKQWPEIASELEKLGTRHEYWDNPPNPGDEDTVACTSNPVTGPKRLAL